MLELRAQGHLAEVETRTQTDLAEAGDRKRYSPHLHPRRTGEGEIPWLLPPATFLTVLPICQSQPETSRGTRALQPASGTLSPLVLVPSAPSPLVRPGLSLQLQGAQKRWNLLVFGIQMKS